MTFMVGLDEGGVDFLHFHQAGNIAVLWASVFQRSRRKKPKTRKVVLKTAQEKSKAPAYFCDHSLKKNQQLKKVFKKFMLLQCSSVNTEIKTLIQQSHRWDWAWSWRWTVRGRVCNPKPSLLPEPKSHEPFWLRCLQEVSRSISARVQVSFELLNGLFFGFFFSWRLILRMIFIVSLGLLHPFFQRNLSVCRGMSHCPTRLSAEE